MTNLVLNQDLYADPFRVLFYKALDQHEMNSIADRIEFLDRLSEGLHQVENDIKNASETGGWMGIVSGFSAALSIGAFISLPILPVAILAGVGTVSAISGVSVTVHRKAKLSPVQEELERHYLALISTESINWASLWEYCHKSTSNGDEAFRHLLFKASRGTIHGDRLIRSDNTKEPFIAANKALASRQGRKVDEVAMFVRSIKESFLNHQIKPVDSGWVPIPQELPEHEPVRIVTRLGEQSAIEVPAQSSPAQSFTIPIASPDSNLFDWNLLNTAYDDFPHLLLLGKTGAGKSFLAERLGRFLDGVTIVITPKKKPKDFIGMQVIGVPYDFKAIAANIAGLSLLVKQREDELNRTGKEDFEPINVVLDDFPSSIAGCRDLEIDITKDLRFIIRNARTSRVRLILLAQGQEVKTLGFEGEGSLRDNLSYVYLKGFAEAQAKDLKLDISQYDRPCLIDGKVADINALVALTNQKLSEKPPIASTPEALNRMYRMESEDPTISTDDEAIEQFSSLEEIKAAIPDLKPKGYEIAALVVDWLRKKSGESFPTHAIRSSIARIKSDPNLPSDRLKNLLDILTERGLLIESDGKYSATVNGSSDDYGF